MLWRTSRNTLRAQGATEYLVLLAIVLVIAAVTIAMLTFFSETSGDVQVEENQAYWRSAYPISVVEVSATNIGFIGDTASPAVLVLKNNGPDPIRIDYISSNSTSIGFLNFPTLPDSTVGSVLYLSPGEQKRIGSVISTDPVGYSLLKFYPAGLYIPPGTYSVLPSRTGCDPAVWYPSQHTSKSWGIVYVENFGFQYTEFIDGIGIAKKQMGAKPLIIRCFSA